MSSNSSSVLSLENKWSQEHAAEVIHGLKLLQPPKNWLLRAMDKLCLVHHLEPKVKESFNDENHVSRDQRLE